MHSGKQQKRLNKLYRIKSHTNEKPTPSRPIKCCILLFALGALPAKSRAANAKADFVGGRPLCFACFKCFSTFHLLKAVKKFFIFFTKKHTHSVAIAAIKSCVL